jgi:hypothetical protein
MLGSTIPFLIGMIFVFGDQWWSEEFGHWLIGNPFAWSSKSGKRYVGFAGAWAVLVAALNIGWFTQRVKAFRPPESYETNV